MLFSFQNICWLVKFNVCVTTMKRQTHKANKTHKHTYTHRLREILCQSPQNVFATSIFINIINYWFCRIDFSVLFLLFLLTLHIMFASSLRALCTFKSNCFSSHSFLPSREKYRKKPLNPHLSVLTAYIKAFLFVFLLLSFAQSYRFNELRQCILTTPSFPAHSIYLCDQLLSINYFGQRCMQAYRLIGFRCCKSHAYMQFNAY
jgi:hypothetical protein